MPKRRRTCRSTESSLSRQSNQRRGPSHFSRILGKKLKSKIVYVVNGIPDDMDMVVEHIGPRGVLL